MPTYTAIALDRLIDPGATRMSHSAGPVADTESGSDRWLERRNSTPSRITADEDSSRPVRGRRMPPPRSWLARQESIPSPSAETSLKKAPQWPKISPALYATPETTPSLPDSPTSPSPYIINHKRRGPRLQLQKSSSDSSPLTEKLLDEKLGNNGHLSDAEYERKTSSGHENGSNGSESVEESELESESKGLHDKMAVHVNGDENGVVAAENGVHKVESVSPRLKDRECEAEDFFDPNDSMSFGSCTDGEDFSGERSGRTTTSMGEFYDACEELSSDSGYQSQSSRYDLETELRELRLSLLMEIEKRKQAEDTLNSMQNQWQALRQKLREVGLVLPEYPSSAPVECVTADADSFAEEVCQQVNIARIVSESIGRGVARAECEEEMETQLERKQFEIARLCDRLHYYETMNREMTQRNQEAIEMARRDRQRRKRIQKYIWASVGVSITIGTAALAWSFIPSTKGTSSLSSSSSSSSDHIQSPESISQSK